MYKNKKQVKNFNYKLVIQKRTLINMDRSLWQDKEIAHAEGKDIQ